ncbi:hypothetical protein GBAR_LOCUS16055 [Geodia barretti]|uniref:Uncharacterized protein n=1 Tax=Geodia barretti TaxID=519541 RepID=A0AA35SFE2_GEOBA|nr:hypothetical protein GBAR_LOCUS16055 [Geodia barretti]
MPIIQRPYVPPGDQPPHEDSYVNPGDIPALSVNTAPAPAAAPVEAPSSLDPITFYSDSFHIFSSLYSAVLFFGEQVEEREPILRARIKVSPQMMKAIAVLSAKHVREYEEAVGPIPLPEQVYAAWEIETDGHAH